MQRHFKMHMDIYIPWKTKLKVEKWTWEIKNIDAIIMHWEATMYVSKKLERSQCKKMAKVIKTT